MLDAAIRLFRSKGIRAVGVNAVAADAGVTKATLYSHFASKDALIVAALNERNVEWRRRLTRHFDHRAGDGERVLAVFDAYYEALIEDDYRPCPFVSFMAEFADVSHEGHQIVARHKQSLRKTLADLCQAAGASEPEGLASDITRLLEGAYVMGAVLRDASEITLAKATATRLLFDAVPA
ncbi:TetR family transcriptional regulator [Rhodococcus ruber BKS 20-38]|uniref:TetR family transcriptional regulator n=1 Tax=Rhodococcus ruber BKS 20-38 TaxID=1278076 RepID=M2Z4J1_9NOCA|nr:TetR family transcriptional regulator [Rhodococcus ruber BKS 20-38]